MARIVGTNGDDRYPHELVGTAKADEILGLAGNDTLIGLDGDDVLIGSAGNDVLSGGAGDDVLIGGPGVDVLDGGPGDNIVIQSLLGQFMASTFVPAGQGQSAIPLAELAANLPTLLAQPNA